MNLKFQIFSSVSCLQNEIVQSCRVAEPDQVLLISGGESLDPETRVCTYNAGTDTNPIFLFNKSAIELSVPSPPVSEINRGKFRSSLSADIRLRKSKMMLFFPFKDSELMVLLKNAMDLPVSYSTVVSRTELSQRCYNAAIDIQRSCEQLCHEQHLQQQSWAAVVANLDDITWSVLFMLI